jgi:hypothetical protein
MAFQEIVDDVWNVDVATSDVQVSFIVLQMQSNVWLNENRWLLFTDMYYIYTFYRNFRYRLATEVL